MRNSQSFRKGRERSNCCRSRPLISAHTLNRTYLSCGSIAVPLPEIDHQTVRTNRGRRGIESGRTAHVVAHYFGELPTGTAAPALNVQDPLLAVVQETCLYLNTARFCR